MIIMPGEDDLCAEEGEHSSPYRAPRISAAAFSRRRQRPEPTAG